MYESSSSRERSDGANINVTVAEPQPRPHTPKSPKRRGESLLAWFDRHCERELQKHRAQLNVSLDTATANISQGVSVDRTTCGGPEQTHRLILSQSVSGIEIASRLRGERETDLLDAVEKLAKAEAMVAFEGAVRAAEHAAAQVPPEYAEEAAAASARSFQAELTEAIKEVVPGIRPIEVVGYVGITRPKRPRKSNF